MSSFQTRAFKNLYVLKSSEITSEKSWTSAYTIGTKLQNYWHYSLVSAKVFPHKRVSSKVHRVLKLVSQKLAVKGIEC